MQRLSIATLALTLLTLLVSPTQASEADEKLVLATYKFSNESSTATGFVVSRTQNGVIEYFAVTSNHVFDKMTGNTCILVARSKKENGEYLRREIPLPIRADGKDLWRKDQQHDVAVLRLPAGLGVISIPSECLATEEALAKVFTGDIVKSATFPERTEANGAGFPLMRMGAIASHPIRPTDIHPTFLVDANTWKGDSGSAVMHSTLRYRNDWPMILGITRGMQNITDTVKESRFVEKRSDYPLGIAVVVHAKFAAKLIANY